MNKYEDAKDEAEERREKSEGEGVEGADVERVRIGQSCMRVACSIAECTKVRSRRRDGINRWRGRSGRIDSDVDGQVDG